MASWMDASLVLRQEAAPPDAPAADPPADAIPQCDWETDNTNVGLRIASIFIILVGSSIGVFLPLILARVSKMPVSKHAFFVAKYFGSGVILATAFIHLLSPANSALNDDCLSGILPAYDWAQGIALMTVVVMFFIELMAARFDFGFGHSHAHTHHDPTKEMLSTSGPLPDAEAESKKSLPPADHQTPPPGLPNDLSYPPGGENHLAHHHDHVEGDSHASYGSQLTALLILEFGVVFHSLFIGLTLSGTSELTVLLIVITFHQCFEGLGLGSRLATAQWPPDWKAWTPWALAVGYAITTPLGIAIGLGVNQSLADNAAHSQLANGVFDAISAGILLYTALVELLAHEFMFNPDMRRASLGMQMSAFGCVVVGTGIMALLGKWA